jgi:2-polyprenyl-6-methoxyphenol hydroxylase-like FAD-dependent oxidoreductase
MTKVLIVGGGISGLAAALVLARQGMDVGLVERSPRVEALGSGITLIGPALRALDDLGVVEECLAKGYGSTEFQARTPDGAGIASMPLDGGRPGLPGLLGMKRPDLHRILLERAVAEGVHVRTGLAAVGVENADDGARVALSDGTSIDVDLVVGADGLRSTVRDLVFGPVSPVFQGQACLRAILPRPAEIDQEVQYHGIQYRHVGFTPISADTMYVYCCVPVPDATRPTQEDLPRILAEYLAPFGGPVGAAREHITDPAAVHYAVLETIVADPPWHAGRTVLVGDAAHCTTPQLAAGGAMCLEDALVLGAELAGASTLPAGLAAYSKRRFDRCRYVVESSAQLSAWQILPVTPDEEQRRLFGEALGVLAEPY